MQPLEMLRHVEGAIEHPAPGQLLEPLRTADQPAARRLAGVESSDEQLKQARIRRQQLEEQTAKSICFHETHKLSERRIGIGRAAEPGQQQRPQLAKNLPGARRDVKSRRPLAELGKRFLPPVPSSRNFGEIDRARILDR